jgi:pyruvate kinase
MMVEARGREIRLSQVNDPTGYIEIRGGQVFTLNCLNPAALSDTKTLYCNCDIIHRYLKPNDVVYFDDGKMVAVVLEILNEGCVMEAKVGGPLKSNA